MAQDQREVFYVILSEDYRLMNMNGKIVVVTGGAEGIGAALCRRAAREGARVTVADIDEAGAGVLAEEIGGLALGCDVSREADVVRVVQHTEEMLGPIDCFFSNAGIIVMGDLDVANADWQRIWEINVMSHVYAARAVVPGMLARGGGWFVCTASAAGLLSQIGSAPYSVTKHAAVGFAENLAITYGDRGLKVAVVCPQAVRTRMTARGGGVAAVDGMMEADQVADCVMAALQEGRFMVLPHPEVRDYMQRKTSDYDRWIHGMQRLKARFQSAPAGPPAS
jgi:NAD(P)-dependent dehydrogenase (short-subunit alcohol dehydrogenase family)